MKASLRNKFVKIKKIILFPFLNNPIIKRRVEKFHRYMRSRLNISEPPTIFCSNCVGGIISHNLGLKFMSPTVNLNISNADFIKIVTNFDYYLNCELVYNPKRSAEADCPVGMLDDVEIDFIHYKTFDEAKEKWNERKKRINFDNLFIIMLLGPKEMNKFEQLDKVKCKRKIALTPCDIPGYDFAFPLKQYEGKAFVSQIAGLSFDGFRPFEKEFDYVAWLNGEKEFRTKYFKKYRS